MGWRIGELLVQKKWLSWECLEKALEEQKSSKQMLGQILVEKNYVSKYLLYRALAEQAKMKFVDLKKTRINPAAISLIPLQMALKHEILPIEVRTGKLFIAISNVLNTWPEAEIKSQTGFEKIETVLSLPEQIREAIKNEYYKLEPSPS